MASRNPLLPTQAQCLSLTDDQCRMFQETLDPEGVRAYKDWAVPYQPDLIRLYMTMANFPQIENAMKRKLDCSYKTYNNRFRAWRFPTTQYERENMVVKLYAMVSNSNKPDAAADASSQARALLPIRASRSEPSSRTIGSYMLIPPQQIEPNEPTIENRMSILTINT